MNPTKIDRRMMLSGSLALATTIASAKATAQQMTPPMMGVLGKAGRGPGRPVIAMLAHPKMVLQDFVGPLTVFNLMHSEIHILWKSLDPVMTEVGVPIQPTTTLEDCPMNVDVLFVPGGLGGSIEMMEDDTVLAFLSRCGSSAKYVTSVCTGSLVLGAAGLLRGYRATSLWNVRDLLPAMGAIVSDERVVHDRNRLTGGGVTAGIDFGLTLCAMLKGKAEAQRVQLTIEYAPKPPFNAGSPATAPKLLVDNLLKARKPAHAQTLLIAQHRAASWR